MAKQIQLTQKKRIEVLKTSSSSSEHFIGRIEQAADFIRPNEHIWTGYRINFNSSKKLLKSLFMIHNESGNIWTHIFGFTLLIFLIFEGISYELEKNHVIGRNFVNGFIIPYLKCNNHQPFNKNNALVSDVHENIFEWFNIGEQKSEYFNENIPTWPIMIMLLGIAFALACSVAYHTFHPLNKKICKILLELDFVGIGTCLGFGLVPMFYYYFYNSQIIGSIYISTNIFGAFSFTYFSIKFQFVQQKINMYKYITIVIYSSSVVVGLGHILLQEMLGNPKEKNFSIIPSLYFYIPGMMSAMIGGLTYFLRCPQRYKPGKFDLLGHSHQIWHTCVNITAILAYLGSLTCFQLTSINKNCPP